MVLRAQPYTPNTPPPVRASRSIHFGPSYQRLDGLFGAAVHTEHAAARPALAVRSASAQPRCRKRPVGPFEGSGTHRPGRRLAVRAIRSASAQLRCQRLPLFDAAALIEYTPVPYPSQTIHLALPQSQASRFHKAEPIHQAGRLRGEADSGDGAGPGGTDEGEGQPAVETSGE
jgi:hypothetical protein